MILIQAYNEQEQLLSKLQCKDSKMIVKTEYTAGKLNIRIDFFIGIEDVTEETINAFLQSVNLQNDNNITHVKLFSTTMNKYILVFDSNTISNIRVAKSPSGLNFQLVLYASIDADNIQQIIP